jgi:2-polyprenyl-3-methyl-5-hydroxy-6-metoxy-1,4-benzoquinol methylase
MAVTATPNKCLNCDSERFDEIWRLDQFPILFGAVPATKKDAVKKYPLTISVCQNCSLVQQTNLLPKNIINDIYEEEYYSCPSPASNQMGSNIVDEFYTFFKDTIHLPVKENNGGKLGKLLEIGCFDGFLLQKFEDAWEVYGCDPSTATGRIASARFGKDRIRNNFFIKDDYTQHEFDVIILRNVLEHLYELHSFLNAVVYCLKLIGCIYIQIPNVNYILKNGSFGSFFHQHISYFSETMIRNLLNTHGFKIENIKTNEFLYVKAIRIENSYASGTLIDHNRLRPELNDFYMKTKIIKDCLRSIFDDPRVERVAIFGASVMATVILHFINGEQKRRISGIFDNDSEKQGKYLVGGDIVIESPDEIRKRNFDLILVSSVIYYDDIYKQLIEMGIDNTKIVSLNLPLV